MQLNLIHIIMEGYLGEIIMVAFDRLPSNEWMFCEGQLLNVSDSPALFALLGNQYGGEPGRTFALPDLRGRVVMHSGQGAGLTNRVQGQTGGERQYLLTPDEMPQHNHLATPKIKASSLSAATGQIENGVPALTGAYDEESGENFVAQVFTTADAQPSNTLVSNTARVTVGIAGGNGPHENMQPYLAVKFAICVRGIFPLREA